MRGDLLERGLAEVVGSGRGALPGLLPVGFPDPTQQPATPSTVHPTLTPEE